MSDPLRFESCGNGGGGGGVGPSSASPGARINGRMPSSSSTPPPPGGNGSLSKQIAALKLSRGRCDLGSDGSLGRIGGTGSLGAAEEFEDHHSIKEEDEDQLEDENNKDNAFNDEEENNTGVSSSPGGSNTASRHPLTESFDRGSAGGGSSRPWASSHVSSVKGESCSSYSSLNYDDGLSITSQECNRLQFLAARSNTAGVSGNGASTSTANYQDSAMPIGAPPVNYQRKYSLTVPGEPRHMRTLGRRESGSRSPLNSSCGGLSHSEMSTPSPSPSCSNSL